MRGNEDISDNYNVIPVTGHLFINPLDVTINLANISQEYNGLEVHSNEWSYPIDSNHFIEGNIIVNTIGSRIDVGYTSIVLESPVEIIIDGIDRADNYNITCNPGSINITPISLLINTKDGQYKTYDGLPFHGEEVKFSDIVNNIDEFIYLGNEFDQIVERIEIVDYNKEIINYSNSHSNYVTVRVVKSDGTVSDNYSISYGKFGTIKVLKKDVEYNTKSGSRDYNGQAYFNSDNVFSDFISGTVDVIAGEDIQVISYTRIVNAGTYNYDVTFKVTKKDGTDSTGNYNFIRKTAGKIVINSLPISIISPDIECYYNGKAIYTETIKPEVTYEGYLVPGDEIIVNTYIKTMINVGEYKNVVYVSINPAGDTTKNNNYNITYVNGTVKILAVDLEIETASYTYDYDGEIHYENTFKKFIGLVEGQKYEITNYTKIEFPGVKDNVISYKIVDSEGKEVSLLNYNISEKRGKLEMFAEIEVSSESYTKTFDGRELTRQKSTILFNGLKLKTTNEITINISDWANLVLADEILNSFKYDILNSKGESLIELGYCHVRSEEFGTLKIVKADVMVNPGTYTLYYGDSINSSDIPVVTDIHSIIRNVQEVKYGFGIYDEIEDIGTYYDAITIKSVSLTLIVNGVEYDATDSINPTFGSSDIVVKTESARKPMDFTELTCDKYKLYGELAPGHTIIVIINGSVIYGTADNTVESITILDKYGYDVTGKYDITVILGKLVAE